MAADAALAFLSELVEAEGGAAEDRGDSVVLLVADELRDRLRLPEELVATSDPEVAAEEGGLLVAPGQAVIVEAADLVLSRGDAGWRHLEWPASPAPARDRLQEVARAEVIVEHGRIDLEGQPSSCYLPVVRVAALLEHRVSVEERYEEAVEVFVDGRTGAPLGERLADQLASLAGSPGMGGGHAHAEAELPRALRACHALLEARAAERQVALVREARAALDGERRRVDAYYEAALASIAARRATAPPARARLLDAQEEATRAEWSRRVLETEEKFAGSAEIRPFLLHVVEIPGLAVPVTVRRGPRRFDLRLDWLLPFASYATPTCPHCGELAPLVAGRDRLGCRTCLPRPVHEIAPGAGDPAGHDDCRPEAPKHPQRSGPRAERCQPAGRPVVEATGAEPEVQPASSAVQERLVEKLWRGVAEALFQAVAFGERCRSVAPRSPLEALYRCYGPGAPLVGLGLPADAWPVSVHSSPPQGQAGEVLATTGELRTSDGTTSFTLRWRLAGKRASLVEVLPGRTGAGPELPPSRRVAGPFPPAPQPLGLGPVEALLWRNEAGEGAPLAVRCLALYWRVQGHRRLHALSDEALAAAVAVLALRRSGRRSGLETVARRYHVPTAAVRQAGAVVEQVLGAATAHLW